MPDFEPRFDAQLSCFKGLPTHTAISDTMAALILLANSDVEFGQPIVILAGAYPSANLIDGLCSISSTLELLLYESSSGEFGNVKINTYSLKIDPN